MFNIIWANGSPHPPVHAANPLSTVAALQIVTRSSIKNFISSLLSFNTPTKPISATASALGSALSSILVSVSVSASQMISHLRLQRLQFTGLKTAKLFCWNWVFHSKTLQAWSSQRRISTSHSFVNCLVFTPCESLSFLHPLPPESAWKTAISVENKNVFFTVQFSAQRWSKSP